MASVVLKTFRGGNITPQNDAIIYQTVIPGAGIFKGCDITVSRGNVLHIAQGYGMIKGRFFEMYENEVSVELPDTGVTKDGRIYLRMDLSNADEPLKIVVETGYDFAKLLMDQNVNYNNSVYDLELAEFKVEAGGIKNLQQVFPMVQAGGGAGGGGGATGIARDTAYVEGDMATVAAAPGWAVMVCTQAGTTALGEPTGYAQIIEPGDTVLDGTAVFTARDIMSELDSIPAMKDSISAMETALANPGTVKTQVMLLSAYTALRTKDATTVYFCYDNETSKKITAIYWGQTAVYSTTVQVTYIYGKSNTQIKRTMNMYDDAVALAPTVTMDGYEFHGWRDTAAVSEDVLPERMLTTATAVTLYAIFKKKLRVTMVPNGGTLQAGKTSPVVEAMQYVYNTTSTQPEIILPECPYEKQGQVFAGYSKDASTSLPTLYPGDALKLTGDTVLYPIYTDAVYEFPYTGSYQPFTAPVAGIYQFEVYGASGGDVSDTVDGKTVTAKGGKGGHTTAHKKMTKGEIVYIFNGGKGSGTVAGANTACAGNSTSTDKGAGGGGATHIATIAGNIGSSNLAYNNKTKVLIVAGGGGGAGIASKDIEDITGAPNAGCVKGPHDGGDGGGDVGGDGSGGALGGRQTSTGNSPDTNFGKAPTYTTGSSSSNQTPTVAVSGGGSGWYGGGYGTNGNSGAGGSGSYESMPPFTYKDVYYGASNEAGVREGNGYAIIRYIHCL